MKPKTIITISRQFGSGGREIGKRLAEKLKIPFYDKEIIDIAAKESGIDVEHFEDEENRTSKGFYILGTIGYTLGSPITGISEMSINDRMFLIQSEVIEQVAEKGPCVIVGRCADYVLQEREDTLHVFLHANMKDRVKRAVNDYEVDERDINGSIMKIDKRRANYYNYYTDRKWGRADNYDLCVNTSVFDIDGTVDLIASLITTPTK